jgi:hypothetical protein
MNSLVPIKPVELMDGNFDQFIGIWENHVPKSVCDKVIESLEGAISMSSNNFGDEMQTPVFDGTSQFGNKNLGRKDVSIMLNMHDVEKAVELNQYLHACFLDYIREYGNLSQAPLISTDVKVQKTLPAGGYHVWHCENSNYQHAQRTLVWGIYLNDVEDGGETEFLYQSVRIKPKTGTVVIWPAPFTHVHRGNPPLSGAKYIATGWYINGIVTK